MSTPMVLCPPGTYHTLPFFLSITTEGRLFVFAASAFSARYCFSTMANSESASRSWPVSMPKKRIHSARPKGEVSI